jgi:ABC-type antimicrobial peptide transport system permease subunit
MSHQFSNLFRFLRKNGTFTIINIAGLAFGFTCAIFILLHASKEYSYNSQIPDSERVFNLVQKSPDSPLGNTTISYALTPLLAIKFPEIEYAARTENFSNFSNCIVSYKSPGDSVCTSFNESSFCLADKDIFQIMQYPFIEGSRENALKEMHSIVLSKETARKYFGNHPALGKTLTLNDKEFFTVTGVVDIPEYVTFNFSMLAPINALRSESYLTGWDSNGEPYFKLRANVNYKEFNKKIEHFYSVYRPEQLRSPEQLTLSLIPITERRLYYNKNPLYLLIFIGFMVLSVSILNYVNMSTSLVQKRTSEIALKKISGANRIMVGFQFFLETAIICFMAILACSFLTYYGIPWFKTLTGSDIQPFFKDHVYFFISSSIFLWIFVSVAASLYPALILAGIQPLTLFSKNKKALSGIKSKNVVITFQFIISIILIIITLGIGRQYTYMSQMPLGFDNKLVMQIPFNDILKENYPNLRNELTKISSIKNICAASAMPAGIPNHSGVEWTDKYGNKQEESFGFAIVTDGYTQTFDMNMAFGNEFIGSRPEELKGVIINETAAKRLGFNNPVGKQLYFWGKKNTIIGVVKDFQNNYLFSAIKPMVISAHPDNQHFTKFLYISILPGDVHQTIKTIEKTLKGIAPSFPFQYSFTSAEVESYINEVKQMNSAFRFASIVSILLALIGLIALTYHAIQSRIKEIGVRKVNGAKNFEIIHLLNASFISCVLIAYVIACPISWLIINKLSQGIANKASISWLIFAAAGLIVGIAALLTISIQSYKAAARNPVEALRYE